MNNSVSIKFKNLANRARMIDNLIGRDKEIRRLVQILLKPKHHNAVITGKAGVGKTSLINLLVQAISAGAIPGLPQKIYELDINPIINMFITGDSVHRCFEAIRINLANLPDGAVIVVEDIQLLSANDPTRLEQTVSLLQMMSDLPGIRLITTTTASAYEKIFRDDYLFGRLFVSINLSKLDNQMVSNILTQAFADQAISASTETIASIVKFTSRYHHGRELPDAGLRLIEDLVVRAKFENKKEITPTDIESFISERERIPISNLSQDNLADLSSLERNLNKSVIGQPDAMKYISRSIIKNELGLGDSNRPRGSFLLLGPSGVGKTETAKTLSNHLFGDPKAMVRLDMSEFSESHTAVRLTGSPVGYVGYEEGGQLTGAVLRQPYSLILLDEIEKAHVKLFDVFLQLLDDGRLTDSGGTTVDFTHTMVMATSNIGSAEIAKAHSAGIDTSNQDFINATIMPILLNTFRPEFINRFDAILIYKPLDIPKLVDIAQRELASLEKRLKSHQIKLRVPDDTLTHLLEKDYNPLFGARPVRRLIADRFEMPIAEQLVQGTISNGSIIIGDETWLST